MSDAGRDHPASLIRDFSPGGIVRHRTIVGLIIVLAGLLGATERAYAQAPSVAPPPVNNSIDARGVDVITGLFHYGKREFTIGDSDQGLSYDRSFVGTGWRDTLTGTIFVNGTQVIVSLGSDSEEFVTSGSSFVPVEDRGSTLIINGDGYYVYTTADGVKSYFVQGYLQPSGQPSAVARISEIVSPNGAYLHFVYKGLNVRVSPSQPETTTFYRVQSIESSFGYQIQLRFQTEDPLYQAQLASAYTVISAVGFNKTIDQCYSYQTSCTYSRNWPSVSYVYDYSTSSFSWTDNLGRVTTYTSNSNGLTSVKVPGSTSPDIQISYVGGKVSSIAFGSEIWTYTYSLSGTQLTTSISGPLSQHETYVSDTTSNRVVSVTDALSHTTSYQYDGQRRLIRVTQPEGNYTQWTYGARGNVVEVREVAKPGSGQADIVTSASYPATCAATASCNRPLTTTDPRGAVTEYAWNDTHGGIESITEPAPTTGADRPQTRYSYETRYPWFKNDFGVVSQQTPHIMPVGSSTCATGVAALPTSCIGTASETRTAITYETSGAATNLLPISTGVSAGDGSISAQTAMTYDPNGDVISSDGPLSGTGDTYTFRYDVGRRLVGVIGPDPDGAGPLLNRARRVTYTPRGRITLTEAGTTPGTSDSAWGAFSTLQRSEVIFDGVGRPIKGMQQAADGTPHTLQQVSYDAAGRPECSATRMNPGIYSSLPVSACSLGAASWYGPDRITQTIYDAAGRPVSTVNGVGTGSTVTEHATYTANGMPATLTDGNGSLSVMNYDGFDRLAGLYYPNPSSPGAINLSDFEAYGYDAAGNVVTYRNRAGEFIGMGYDNLGRRITMGGSAIADRTFSYDNLNRPITTAFTGGGPSSTNGWDALSRLTSQTESPLGTVSYTYDAIGRRLAVYWPDGVYATYEYNVLDPTGIRENGSGLLIAYAHDNLGRLIQSYRGNGVWSNYGYDGISRLAWMNNDPSDTAQDVAWNYTYNPASQIISRSVSNSAYVYTPASTAVAYVNNLLNRLTSINGSAVGYDGRGNITSAPGATYGYNAENQMTSASTSLGSSGYAFDPTGRLYQAIGGTNRRFLYDGQQVIAEYNESGVIQNRYVPGLGLDDVVTSYDAGGNRTWLLSDERQSVVALTNGSGAATAINTYDEYGVPGASNTGRFQYTGQMWLPDAQLYHYRARAYAPQIGRFMQTDPMGYGAGANLYAYVRGDPANFVDPTGMQEAPEKSRCAVGGWCDQPVTRLSEVHVGGSGCTGACAQLQLILAKFNFNRVDKDFVRPYVFNDPRQCGGRCWMTAEQWAFAELRDKLLEENAWMVDLVLLAPGLLIEAPVVVPVKGASLIAKLCNCFTGETLVQTEAGQRRIDEIAIGDLVLARDEITGETAYKAVTALVDGSERSIWEVTVTASHNGASASEVINTTDEHPWRLANGTWAKTVDLRQGDELVSSSGGAVVVVTVRQTSRVEKTYNLEVDGFHTFFVGSSSVWVHNSCLLMEGATNLRNVETIARGRGIRTVQELVSRFGGRADQWRKMKGVAEVGGRTAEVHWYQNDSLGRFLGKVKYWL